MARKLCIAILMMAMLTGCRAGPPWMQWMYKGPPPGKEYTPLYVEGWQHGCETGAAGVVGPWYKMFYHFKQDWSKAQDPVYYKGWKDALRYCSRYLFQYTRRHVL